MVRLSQIILSLSVLLLFSTGPTAFGQDVELLDRDFRALTLSDGNLIGITPESAILSATGDFSAFTQRRGIPAENLESYFAAEASGSLVIVVGSDGRILRSTNAGVSWVSLEATPVLFGDLLAVSPGPEGVWAAVGEDGFDGAVVTSADGGITWERSATLNDASLTAIAWTGERWIACGDNSFGAGLIFESTDGISWNAVALNSSFTGFTAAASDGAGTVIVAGESGTLLRSTDHGLSFSPLDPGSYSGTFRSIAPGSGSSFLVSGDERTVLSISGATVDEVVPYGNGAPAVLDLVLANGTLFLGGDFSTFSGADIPLSLLAEYQGDDILLIQLRRSSPLNLYYLESSPDLESWTRIENSLRAGTGESLSWEVSVDAIEFWRVVEE